MADKNLNEELVEETEAVETEVTEEADVAATEKTAENDSPASDKKAAKKSKKTEDKPNFFKRVGAALKKFWKSYKSEIKKITWFSRKQTFVSTLLVLICVVVSAIVIGVLDLGFSNVIQGLGKLF